MGYTFGLSGIQFPMRIREDFQNNVANQVIGYTSVRNLATGASSKPSPVMASCGEHIDRVSIDENHGRPPYTESGPLCLYQLRRPTYVSGSSSIMGKRINTGATLFIDGKQVVVKSTDDWRHVYTGGFTKNTSGLPSSLGAAESYRPRSFDSSQPTIDPSDLSDLGNRAYGLLRPKLEKASLTQSLVEIGSAKPMLKTSLKGFHELWQSVIGGYAGGRLGPLRHRPKGSNAPWTMSPKGAGDQFLNLQFGWRPALQDFLAVCETVGDLEALVAQAEQNNGQWVSRRFLEDVVESEQVVYSQSGVTGNLCNPVLNSQYQLVPFSGSQTVKLQTLRYIWYEGSFKQYRPEFDPALRRGHPALKAAEQAALKLGLRINPTTLYRCIPYTWLADYVGSFTSGIQRLEDQLTGEMVCRRFHLMRTVLYRYEYRVQFSTTDGQTHVHTWYKQASVKRRANGQSAFGFSASPGGLTGMQYAILAALASSKAG